ncbi:M56 family metallopeptidase [Blastopirellula marina]|uniref:Thioredoxin domain-containing protein n=1 Tax=Blastopirellula marina TaxID=124 RepID=A0A2S8GU48_9BACT|nr:M56 family metallopeptidase [Blastopirellula marina]PQO47932.1 hypothetical protein C5Y93_00665 [Blastopirellula marina]
MMIANLLSTDDLARIGAALCHFLWQGTVLGLLAAVASLTLRRSTPQTRYAVFICFFLLAPCCLLATYVWLQPTAAPLSAQTLIAESPSPPTTPIAAPVLPAIEQPPIAMPPQTMEPPAVASPENNFETALSLLALLWGIGVALLSLRLVGGYWRLCRDARRHATPLAPTWLQIAERLAAAMQVRRKIVWLQSAVVESPLTFGWLRPIVVTPSALLTGLTVAEVECLLAHELAHIRRHDFLVNLLQSAVETLLFYHPAIWWISRQIRFEREQICDEIAIAAVGDRVTYGKALLSVASAAPVEALALAAGDSDLKRRIQRIFGITPSPVLGKAKLLGAIVSGLLILIGFSCAVIWNAAPTAAEDSIPPVEFFVEHASLRLQPIAGRVLDEQGKPVADVPVVLRSNRWNRVEGVISGQQGDIAATRTNADGRYRFDDVPFDLGPPHQHVRLAYLPLDVAVIDQSHAVGWRHLQGDQSHLSADITLTPPATLTGRVVDPQGQPVAGAQVSVMYCMSLRHITQADLEDGRWPKYTDRDFINFRDSRIMPQATTDADGRFRLTGLPPQRGFGLQIRHADYLDDFAFAATVAQLDKRDRDLMKRNVQTGNVRVELKQGRKLTLQVVADDTGEPIQAVEYYAYDLPGAPPIQFTDQQGQMVRNIPSNWSHIPYALYPPSGVDYLPTSGVAHFEEDQQQLKITVRLKKGAVIAGKAIDETTQRGIAGLPLQIFGTLATPDTPPRRFVETDEMGNFRAVVPPGKATASLSLGYRQWKFQLAPDQRPPTWEVSLANPIKDAVLQLKPAPTIDGVVHAPDGQPLANVVINYQIPLGTNSDGLRGYIPQQILADDQGRFSLVGLENVWKQDWVEKIPIEFRDRRSNQRRVISLDESAWQTPLQVHMQSQAIVTGRLIDADLKRPVRKGPVDCYYLVPPADGDGPAIRHHVSFIPDQFGRFRLELDHEGQCESLLPPSKDYQERMLPGDAAQRTLSFDKPLELGDILIAPVGKPDEREITKFVMPPFDPALGQAEFDRLAQQFAVDHAAYEQERAATQSRRRQQLLDEQADPTPEYLFAMLAIAKANRGSEAEFAALHWIAKLPYNHYRAAIHYPQQRLEAVELLMTHYAHRPQLSDCVANLLHRQDPYGDPIGKRMERADRLIEQNQSRIARGQACYRIGMQLTESQYPALPQPQNPNELAERYLQRVVDEFADLPLYSGKTIGEAAEQELFELRNLQPGSAAPDFIGNDPTGKQLQLSDFQGKYVLLNFWGSWCGPCIHKLPELEKLAADFPDRLVILGVMSDTVENGAAAIDQHQVKFPNVIDGPHGEGKIVRQWNVNRWPTSYLIDPEGKIALRPAELETIRRELQRLTAAEDLPGEASAE